MKVPSLGKGVAQWKKKNVLHMFSFVHPLEVAIGCNSTQFHGCRQHQVCLCSNDRDQDDQNNDNVMKNKNNSTILNITSNRHYSPSPSPASPRQPWT